MQSGGVKVRTVEILNQFTNYQLAYSFPASTESDLIKNLTFPHGPV